MHQRCFHFTFQNRCIAGGNIFLHTLGNKLAVLASVEFRSQLFHGGVHPFQEHVEINFPAFQEHETQLVHVPVEEPCPHYAAGVLEVCLQGEVVPDEAVVVFIIQHTLDVTEHGSVNLGAEFQRVHPPRHFCLDPVQGIPVDFGQGFIVGCGHALLQLFQGEGSAVDEHVGCFDAQKTRFQQRLEVVSVHFQQEKAGEFRRGGNFPHDPPGNLQLLPDDVVDFFRRKLFGTQVSAVPGFQQQRQRFLKRTCLVDTSQLGRVQHLCGELADTAYCVFITCLRHAISPPRQRACPPLPFRSGCGHPS